MYLYKVEYLEYADQIGTFTAYVVAEKPEDIEKKLIEAKKISLPFSVYDSNSKGRVVNYQKIDKVII